MSELITKDWKLYKYQTVVSRYREGWHGVWDALVAAVTKKQRYAIRENVTVSAWAKITDHEPEIYHLTLEVTP